MNVSDFVGKTVKEIVIEEKVGEHVQGKLIIFTDGSMIMSNEVAEIFYTPEGNNVIDDIEHVNFREFASRLPD